MPSHAKRITHNANSQLAKACTIYAVACFAPKATLQSETCTERVMWHLLVCVLRSQLWGQSTVDRAQEAAAVRRDQNHHVTDQAHRSLHPDQSPGGPVQRSRLAHQRLRPLLLQWVSERPSHRPRLLVILSHLLMRERYFLCERARE